MTQHLHATSDLRLRAVGTQGRERVSDPCQLHGAEVAKDLVVPLGRPAPGEGKRQAEGERAGGATCFLLGDRHSA